MFTLRGVTVLYGLQVGVFAAMTNSSSMSLISSAVHGGGESLVACDDGELSSTSPSDEPSQIGGGLVVLVDVGAGVVVLGARVVVGGVDVVSTSDDGALVATLSVSAMAIKVMRLIERMAGGRDV
jgi:hypothetical protein